MKMEKSEITSNNELDIRNERKINNLVYLKEIKSVLNDFAVNSVKDLKTVFREISGKEEMFETV